MRWTAERVAEKEEEEEEEEEEEDDDWVISGKVEHKRLPGIKEMMSRRIPISATSIRSNTGGTMSVAARIIAKNKQKIDTYNASLHK